MWLEISSCLNSPKLCQFLAVLWWEKQMCCAVYYWTLGMCPLFARSDAGGIVFTFPIQETFLYVYVIFERFLFCVYGQQSEFYEFK
jgi:hypothetical protein